VPLQNRPFCFTSRTFFGIAVGLAMGSTIALADDAQSARACDVAAASPTDPMRPAGIAGVPVSEINGKAVQTCQAAFAVASGNLRIMSELARALQAANNFERARSMYVSAADQGYADAQLWVGRHYEAGDAGFPKNEREAVHYYKLAVEQGHAWAQAMLGAVYQEGRGGLAANGAEAARLYKLAADQGNAAAQMGLGIMYRNGTGGLPRDDREAARLLRLAADRGSDLAQYNLGVMYYEGDGGLPQDDREAARLFKLAADQGNANAQHNLGVMYGDGRGVDQNDGMAVYWYSKAAEQGDSEAKAALAEYQARVQQASKTAKVPSALHYACWLETMQKTPGDLNKIDQKVFDRTMAECIDAYVTKGRTPLGNQR
jgi:TPR repeat protein